MVMRFAMLGPLRVTSGGVELPLSGTKRRALLIALMTEVGRVVSADRLAAIVWSGPPPTARSALHNHVLALRRALADPDGAVVRTEPGGYRLDVDPAHVDVWEFEDRLRRGRSAHQARQWAEASAELGRALALWRGEPLSDMASPPLDDAVRRWSQQRLQALEWRIDCDLRLGRHADVVAELSDLVEKHPMREGLAGALMRAFYGSGRQAEALAVYQRTHRTLVTELGVEPGAELKSLQREILAESPALKPQRAVVRTDGAGRPGLAAPVPEQLPADIGDFTGRLRQLRTLRSLLSSARLGAPLPLAVVTGVGGIGKTALAVHTAHRVRALFPDGQLYADLRGFSGQRPRTAAAVLARFLRDLGVPDAGIPVEEEELAVRYRTLMSGRRMLVVLDDAGDVRQVRPLLPGTGGCAVVITSRNRLAGLLAGQAVELDALAPREANQLFSDIVGVRRTGAEPTATAQVLHACAGLPLAVQIAARRLADRPGWSVQSLATRLADERTRLSELGTADAAVRATFRASYEALPGPDASRAFRLLGVAPIPDIGLAAAARLLDTAEADAETALEVLVDAHLLTSPAPGRYHLHDLLRVYAAECAHVQESEEERTKAGQRLLDWYLLTASVGPAPAGDNSPAHQWFEAEHETLVAAFRWAADIGMP